VAIKCFNVYSIFYRAAIRNFVIPFITETRTLILNHENEIDPKSKADFPKVVSAKTKIKSEKWLHAEIIDNETKHNEYENETE